MKDPRFTHVPLFVSRNTLAKVVNLPRAVGTWALDSGGFTELQRHGRWTISAATYAAEVRRYRDAVGGLAWAAPMDWMCEAQVIAGKVERVAKPACEGCTKRRLPSAIAVTGRLPDGRQVFTCKRCGTTSSKVAAPPINPFAWRAWAGEAGPVMAAAVRRFDMLGDAAEVIFHGTGLSVAEHQARTVDNLLELRALAPDLPWTPVVQGWTLGDYLDCLDLYDKAGVDLRAEPLVGVGSVCRRQDTMHAGLIFLCLADEGLRLHGFGVKIEGVRLHGHMLTSADSMAWSEHAKHHPPLEGHDRPGPGRTTGHAHCQNCSDFALEWRDRLLVKMHHADRQRSMPMSGLLAEGDGV